MEYRQKHLASYYAYSEELNTGTNKVLMRINGINWG